MSIQHWFDLLRDQLYSTALLQWIAVAFGVAQVLLAKQNKVALYPAGIIASFISFFMLIDVQLYAEAVLHLYYFFVSIYGWLLWSRRRNVPPVEISYANTRDWCITAGIIILGWGVLYAVLKTFTSSDVAGWDAWISATAWAGTWLLAKRKIENWLILNVSNIFAIPLLFNKELVLFSGLTLFLFVVAIFGYFSWRKRYRQQQIEKLTVLSYFTE
jgi:nicotinamide mononucleotide transporter